MRKIIKNNKIRPENRLMIAGKLSALKRSFWHI